MFRLLYDLWNEPFEITAMKEIHHPYEHIQLTCKSSVRFQITHDVYTSSSKNTIYSGDAHAVFPLHPGLMAVILSDGMGNDVEAHRESRRVMQFMRECLNKKMDPETTMHTLHYMMSLQNDNDSYATVDLALIDLQKGELWSWKAGSMSTYLIRGNEMRKIESKHVPFGFLPTFSIEARKMDIKDGDVLVMLSDGVFSGNTTVEKQEQYYQKILQDPNNECRALCEKVRRNILTTRRRSNRYFHASRTCSTRMVPIHTTPNSQIPRKNGTLKEKRKVPVSLDKRWKTNGKGALCLNRLSEATREAGTCS